MLVSAHFKRVPRRTVQDDFPQEIFFMMTRFFDFLSWRSRLFDSLFTLLSLFICIVSVVSLIFTLRLTTSSASGRLESLLILLVWSISLFTALLKIWDRTPIVFRRLQFLPLLGVTSYWCSLTSPWSAKHCPPPPP